MDGIATPLMISFFVSIHVAFQANSLPALKSLIKNNANPYTTDEYGQGLLYNAIQYD